MPRPLFLSLLLLLLAPSCPAADYSPAPVVPPAPQREFRGAWVATVYNIDWPSKASLSPAAQKAELIALLDRAASLNLNAIVLQVRSVCDAIYESRLEPWSAFLTGTMGKSPGYDPLAFAVAEAHKRGIELHAWFNPFRALANATVPVAGNHISKTRPDLTRKYGNQLWLDPGEPEARDLALRVMLDVVRRYDIDGVHIDDYFYPYKVKNKAGEKIDFPDERSWRRYRDAGGKLDRGDWRRSNVTAFVENLYQSVKAEKRWVKVGISPFGIWRPGVPSTIEAQLDAYDDLYADARLWFERGWVDYFAPQLYWSIEPAKQSFPVLLKWWSEQNGKRRHLWPGIATERIGAQRPAGEILDQIRLTRGLGKTEGNIHWSMKALLRNQGKISDLLARDAYAQPALVPASPWLGGGAPARPVLDAHLNGDSVTVNWKGGDGADTKSWLWLLQTLNDRRWKTQVLPAGRASITLASSPEVIALTAVDRLGNVGPASVVQKK